MKKILIINTIGFGYEGITNVIMNYIEKMNRKGLEFFFCVFNTNDHSIKERLKLFGKVIEIPNRKNVYNYLFALNKMLKKQYDVVHIHGNSGTMVMETFLCKLNNVGKTIIHCHSIRTDHPVINGLFKRIAICQANVCLACSKEAGDFLYGKSKYMILNNAIDLEKFRFSENIRVQYRAKLKIDGEVLIGHAGHFTKAKNQKFLVDVFNEYYKINSNSKLLLVGDGPLLNSVKEKVSRMGLQDNVIFAGGRADIEGLYQAMDIFLFPSLWEGLGLAAVEAQVSGLPVLASNNVPEIAGCTDRFFSLDLKLGEKQWGKKMECILKQRDKREALNEKEKQAISDRGYDITTEVKKLEYIYRE